MADHFNEFLDEAEQFDDMQIEDAAVDVTGNNYVCNDEVKSVLRFRSMENSPPSLSSLCIGTICAWMNEATSDPVNERKKKGNLLASVKSVVASLDSTPDRVVDYFQKCVKLLPEDVQAKIISQLSFTTLKCIYKDQVWMLDPLVIAASIKQEEDMLRYLYWKDPTNPLLAYLEQSLIIDVFADKKIIPLLNTKHLAPTDQLKQALVQSYLGPTCFQYQFYDRDAFMNYFHEMANNGCLRYLNWNNVLVVGGIVLGSLRHETQHNPHSFGRYGQYHASDIDIYLYGLTKEQSQAKVEEIYRSILKAWGEPIGIFKTANTITLVASSSFRNIQIILSTYVSPLEILLASDMNSCSIGFNGQTVLTIPRFIFGSTYGSNILDSSTKFGPKLRWERLAKYHFRGYNIASPLHLRVHGHGSFNSEEEIDANIHPSTRQLIELMCLNKIALLRISFGKEDFGLNRESEFHHWPTRWTRGITIMKRCFLKCWNKTEYQRLCDYLPNPPAWVKDYYKRAQNLTLPADSIREAHRYSEETRTSDQLSWGRGPEPQNFNPEKNKDIHKYIEEYCKFDNYNESSLQCFHLNFFVDKEQKETNPYKEMNTSLATLRYTLRTVPLAFKKFDKFLSGKIRSVSSTFQVNNRNWKLSLVWASNAVSFIMLTKEADEEDKESYNNNRSSPTKFFANFLLRMKNLKIVQLPDNTSYEFPRDVTFDGSQVFTYNQPSNTWLTWIRNDYFRGQMNDAAEDWLGSALHHDGIDARPKYVDNNGTINWEVTLQLIEPQFNITNL